MAQENRDKKGKAGPRFRRPLGAQLSLSDNETRAKATLQDIDSLYAALQSLVPKPDQQHQGRKLRNRAHETDADTTRDNEDYDKPKSQNNNRRELNKGGERRPQNLQSIEAILDWESERKKSQKVSWDERLFASDTEIDLYSSVDSDNLPKLQRHSSLPVYDDDSANETQDESCETTPKKSRFRLFRRRRRGQKTAKTKRPSWCNFLASLNFTRKLAKKSKKGRPRRQQQHSFDANKRGKVSKKFSSTDEELDEAPRRDTPTPELSTDGKRRSSVKISASVEPVVGGNLTRVHSVHELIMKTRSLQMNRKLDTWYKNVVRETSLNPSYPSHSKSCENLLTDSEILRAKRTCSTSDTESGAPTDLRNRANLNKMRVRMSREKRNRRKERARWQSLPNVKLVSYALVLANKKAEKSTEKEADMDNKPVKLSTKHTTTVKSLEAKLSFENHAEIDAVSPPNDFMTIQKENTSRWLSRQCSKTTISCIRPIQLNLFYSESPSRETKFRSKKSIEKPKFQFTGSTEGKTCKNSTENTDSSPFRVRQTSSQRRRKRLGLKRQPRLPHQSTFYIPPSPPDPSSKSHYKVNAQNSLENMPPRSKDSGLGLLDHDVNVLRVEPINTSERCAIKPYSESEDSGWASMDKSPAIEQNNAAIQTEAVLATTAVSTIRSKTVTNLTRESAGQSEA